MYPGAAVPSSENSVFSIRVNITSVTCTTAPAQPFSLSRRPIWVLLTVLSDTLSFSAERTATGNRRGRISSLFVHSHISKTTRRPAYSCREHSTSSRMNQQNDKTERIKEVFVPRSRLPHDKLRDLFPLSLLSSFCSIAFLALSLWNVRIVRVRPSVVWYTIWCMV